MKINIIFMIFSVLLLTSCNTVQGVGKDVQKLAGGNDNNNSATVTRVETTEVVPVSSANDY